MKRKPVPHFMSEFQKLCFANSQVKLYELMIDTYDNHKYLLTNDVILSCYAYLFEQDELLVPFFDKICRSLDIITYDINSVIMGNVNRCVNIEVLTYFTRLYKAEQKKMKKEETVTSDTKLSIWKLLLKKIKEDILFE